MARTLTITVNDQPGMTADEQVELAGKAFALLYNRPLMVENPDFRPNQPEDEVNNPRQIENPETEAVFFMKQLKQYIRNIISAYNIRVKEQEAIALAQAQNNSLTPIAEEIQVSMD